ncbi:MAG: DUF3426 domain-containing protein [Alphaproteobacteria bacterium]
MIITCPACATRYNVPDNTVAERARKVRCAKCSHEWLIEPPSAEAAGEPEAAESNAPAEVEQSEVAQAAAAEPEAAEAEEAAPAKGPIRLSTDRRRPIRDLRARRSAADAVSAFVFALLLLGALAFVMIQWRVEIVRAVPMMASVYGAAGIPVNAIGIEIHQKGWQIAQENGLPVLTVNGTITNISGRGVAVPPIELILRDDKQRELYHWQVELSAKHLSPGESQPFQIVKESPPLEAHDVEIRFAPGP